MATLVSAAHVIIQMNGRSTASEMTNIMIMCFHQGNNLSFKYTIAVNDATTPTMTTREKDTFLCKPKHRCLPVTFLYSA